MFSTCVKEFECVIRPEATLSRDVKLQELTIISQLYCYCSVVCLFVFLLLFCGLLFKLVLTRAWIFQLIFVFSGVPLLL